MPVPWILSLCLDMVRGFLWCVAFSQTTWNGVFVFIETEENEGEKYESFYMLGPSNMYAVSDYMLAGQTESRVCRILGGVKKECPSRWLRVSCSLWGVWLCILLAPPGCVFMSTSCPAGTFDVVVYFWCSCCFSACGRVDTMNQAGRNVCVQCGKAMLISR